MEFSFDIWSFISSTVDIASGKASFNCKISGLSVSSFLPVEFNSLKDSLFTDFTKVLLILSDRAVLAESVILVAIPFNFSLDL